MLTKCSDYGDISCGHCRHREKSYKHYRLKEEEKAVTRFL